MCSYSMNMIFLAALVFLPTIFAETLRGKEEESRSLLPGPVAWPGGAVTYTNAAAFTPNFSGIKYVPGNQFMNDVIWGVDNDSVIWKLKWNIQNWGGWIADPAWGINGRPLNVAYDSEGITFGSSTKYGYFSTERIGAGVSRLSILRFSTLNPAAPGAVLTPTNEWVLTALLPVADSNRGLEGLTFIPDYYLQANGFKTNANVLYNPASYPNRVESGIFFAGLEENGNIYGFVLNNGNTASLISSFSSGETRITDLDFDPNTGYLWTSCDNQCAGRHRVFTITNGVFTVKEIFNPPTAAMAALNIEGFTIEPESRCDIITNRKYAYWSNDDNGQLIRAEIKCDEEARLGIFPEPVVCSTPYNFL